jgi:hypothetical protein
MGNAPGDAFRLYIRLLLLAVSVTAVPLESFDCISTLPASRCAVGCWPQVGLLQCLAEQLAASTCIIQRAASHPLNTSLTNNHNSSLTPQLPCDGVHTRSSNDPSSSSLQVAAEHSAADMHNLLPVLCEMQLLLQVCAGCSVKKFVFFLWLHAMQVLPMRLKVLNITSIHPSITRYAQVLENATFSCVDNERELLALRVRWYQCATGCKHVISSSSTLHFQLRYDSSRTRGAPQPTICHPPSCWFGLGLMFG